MGRRGSLLLRMVASLICLPSVVVTFCLFVCLFWNGWVGESLSVLVPHLV